MQLEPGHVLPPAERLKGKILIKDKLLRKKGESTANFNTLTRGSSMNMEAIPEEPKKSISDGADSPMATVTGGLLHVEQLFGSCMFCRRTSLICSPPHLNDH